MRRRAFVLLAAALGVAAGAGAFALGGACGGEISEGESAPCADSWIWVSFALEAVAIGGVGTFLAPTPRTMMTLGAVVLAYGLVGTYLFAAYALSALVAGGALLAAGTWWRERERATRTAP